MNGYTNVVTFLLFCVSVDPIRDIEIINLELALADIAQVEKRIEKCKRDKKGGNAKSEIELQALTRIMEGLTEGRPARKIGEFGGVLG